MHVGQPEIAALEAVGQLCVVEAKQEQDRGVEAELVGLAEREAGFHGVTGQPHRKTIRVTVTGLIRFVRTAINWDHSSFFGDGR